MTDTPRTEAEVACTDSCPMDGVVVVDANFACQLERELNEANERIKRLEEAGTTALFTKNAREALEIWNAAKEDKP